ncbi:Hypothetical protein D9617_195g075130 [Elsinoe fawcettii]|nr:Hypothetical protein D9617_195g075130 [Elsinoe fawcettii]
MTFQNEGRVLLALHAFNQGQFKSLRATAKAFEVCFETLRRRHQGKVSVHNKRSATSKFTIAEEDLLIQRIMDLVHEGFPPRATDVRDIANLILKNKNPQKPETVGQKWVYNFVKRTPQLASVYNRKFDYQRACQEDPKVIQAWFDLVQETIDKYGVPEEDIWNFDETGFQMGVISTSKVITSSDRQGRPRTIQPGNREWVTVIEGINARGWLIPPFVILCGKVHLTTWYQTGIPLNWRLAISDKGWTNDELSLDWIKHFHQHTDLTRKSKWRLLIFDGHGSHMTAKFKEFCLQNNILTLCMPAHSSHILQPLDVSCFAPMKKAYGQQVEAKMRLGNNHIDKVEFLSAFAVVHRQVMTTSNIKAGFAASGLVPFNPTQVLDKLDPILSTPSPRGSDSTWESKTPKTIPEIKKQARLIQSSKRQRRELSRSPTDAHFDRLLKGFETAVHRRAILMAENEALKAENHRIKRKREIKKKMIKEKGPLTIETGSSIAESSQMALQSQQRQLEGREVVIEGRLFSTSKKAAYKCSLCGEEGHRLFQCSLKNKK